MALMTHLAQSLEERKTRAFTRPPKGGARTGKCQRFPLITAIATLGAALRDYGIGGIAVVVNVPGRMIYAPEPIVLTTSFTWTLAVTKLARSVGKLM